MSSLTAAFWLCNVSDKFDVCVASMAEAQSRRDHKTDTVKLGSPLLLIFPAMKAV